MCCMLNRKRVGWESASALLRNAFDLRGRAGYQKMTLWTQSNLYAARHIYKRSGFQVMREQQQHSFGKDLTAETWELNLRQPG